MQINIIGRRWFQRSYGNTYHSVVINIDGKTVFSSGKAYGYDEQYLQTALDWLDASGLVEPRKSYANGGHEAHWQWAERTGHIIANHVSDVARERDL